AYSRARRRSSGGVAVQAPAAAPGRGPAAVRSGPRRGLVCSSYRGSLERFRAPDPGDRRDLPAIGDRLCPESPPNHRRTAPIARLYAVRVGLVCPYSYTYPGGVVAHVEALAEELRRRGHEVRVLAPVDPDNRLSRVHNRGAAPTPRELPRANEFVSLGRTIGFESNGAVSNLSHEPRTAVILGR